MTTSRSTAIFGITRSNNTLDAYAQAFNIASIITSIWGKGKEPFWQQSYTDLVRYVILLHRIRDGYLTMVDIFRTVISAGRLEELMIEVGTRFSATSYIGIDKDAYREHEGLLSPLGFEWREDEGLYLGRLDRDSGTIAGTAYVCGIFCVYAETVPGRAA